MIVDQKKVLSEAKVLQRATEELMKWTWVTITVDLCLSVCLYLHHVGSKVLCGFRLSRVYGDGKGNYGCQRNRGQKWLVDVRKNNLRSQQFVLITGCAAQRGENGLAYMFQRLETTPAKTFLNVFLFHISFYFHPFEMNWWHTGAKSQPKSVSASFSFI